MASSNEGIQKVVYMDPSVAPAGNPLGMLSIQGMSADLSALQSVGKNVQND